MYTGGFNFRLRVQVDVNSKPWQQRCTWLTPDFRFRIKLTFNLKSWQHQVYMGVFIVFIYSLVPSFPIMHTEKWESLVGEITCGELLT